ADDLTRDGSFNLCVTNRPSFHKRSTPLFAPKSGIFTWIRICIQRPRSASPATNGPSPAPLHAPPTLMKPTSESPPPPPQRDALPAGAPLYSRPQYVLNLLLAPLEACSYRALPMASLPFGK